MGGSAREEESTPLPSGVRGRRGVGHERMWVLGDVVLRSASCVFTARPPSRALSSGRAMRAQSAQERSGRARACFPTCLLARSVFAVFLRAWLPALCEGADRSRV